MRAPLFGTAVSDPGIKATLVRSALLLLALGVTACERREAPETRADTAIAVTARCVNEADGYAVSYPAEWHVNAGDILGRCAVFDPDPIHIPENSELPIEFAVMLDVEPVAFSTIAGDVLGRRDRSREPTRVGGREGLRIDTETTGEGLHSAGILMYMYVVDLGDRAMIATTYDVGTVPFERKRRVLDAMMGTLEFSH